MGQGKGQGKKGPGLGKGQGKGLALAGQAKGKDKGKAQGKGKQQAPVMRQSQDPETLAIQEATEQLQQLDGTGNVWIENWNSRFAPTLGPLMREFLERHPDKFTINYSPTKANKFTVSL